MLLIGADGVTTAAWVQAIATVVLVLVTVVYTLRTHGMAKAAKKQSESALRAAQASEQAALSAEHGLILKSMPILFGHRVRNTRASDVAASVILFGFGQPAFAVMVTVTQENNHDGELGPVDHVMPNPDGEQYKLLQSPDFSLIDEQPYTVEVSYYDAFGIGYRTQRRSMVGGQSLSNIERKVPDSNGDLPREWQSLVKTF